MICGENDPLCRYGVAGEALVGGEDTPLETGEADAEGNPGPGEGEKLVELSGPANAGGS